MRSKIILTLLSVTALLSSSMAQSRSNGGGSRRGGNVQKQHISSSYATQNNNFNISMIYGIAAGLTCPILKFDGNNVDVSSNPGFKAGMMWGVDFGKVRVVPELWYSTFKMDFNEDGAGLKGSQIVNKSFDFPIMVGFDLGKGPFRFNMGPSFSLLCDNTLKNDGREYEFGRIKSNVGYCLGLSCDLISNLFLDLRYTGRFTANSNEWSSGREPYDIKMYAIDITAGLRF